MNLTCRMLRLLNTKMETFELHCLCLNVELQEVCFVCLFFFFFKSILKNLFLKMNSFFFYFFFLFSALSERTNLSAEAKKATGARLEQALTTAEQIKAELNQK